MKIIKVDSDFFDRDYYILGIDDRMDCTMPFDKFELSGGIVNLWVGDQLTGGLSGDKAGEFCVAWREMQCREVGD